jgi:acetyl-CoA carboxylase biotin carboxylase subunit
MIEKILIANRGEIALRIIRACHELGIPTVAIYSQADKNSLHVKFADEAVCVGPAQSKGSYLNIPSIIAAAQVTNANAIHPGYGFFAENDNFVEICNDCGITFIGQALMLLKKWGINLLLRKPCGTQEFPLFLAVLASFIQKKKHQR